jgi:hypothetical protein
MRAEIHVPIAWSRPLGVSWRWMDAGAYARYGMLGKLERRLRRGG